MKTTRILSTSVAALLFSAGSILAATDTWDGGGGDFNISTGANWVDNTAPVSDLTNTDLIFGGTVRLTPNFTTEFSARSVTFSNTAGAFVFGGSRLNVGATGIVNNDTQTMTFDNAVSFSSTATPTINAASGGLVFNALVGLPSNFLTVDGAGDVSFNAGFDGVIASRIVKQGAGTMTLSSGGYFDVDIDAGAVETLADGTSNVFQSSTVLAVNGTSTLRFNENAFLNSSQITRASGATVAIAAGKTLTVRLGADVAITGSFTNATASTITVTDEGSTFSTTSGLTLSGGSTTNILAGGSLSSGAANFLTISDSSGDGTVTVDGAGSSLGGGTLRLGFSGGAGSLTLSNAATGTLGAIGVTNSTNSASAGTLNIQSGATLDGTFLVLAPNAVANSGSITISGAGSALTLTSTTTSTIGAASASTGTITVENGGTFSTGSGTTAINATGRLNINGGTVNLLGDATVSGQLTRDTTGVLTLAAEKTLTVQGGGDVTITGGFTNSTASTITVTGADSTFSTTASINANAGTTLNVLASGSISITGGGNMNLGNAGGSGTLLVDGSGSSVSANQLRPGLSGLTGTATFRNSATGTFTSIQVDNSTFAGSNGTLSVESGADLTASTLLLANQAFANTGLVTITGAGSTITITGAGTTTIGAASASSGTLRVQSGGTLTTGTGTVAINATGALQITGGTVNLLGNTTIDGQLTRDAAGTLTLASGKTLTVQNGGDMVITGALALNVPATITVTGAGSTFSTSGAFTLTDGTLALANAGSATFTGGLTHSGTLNISSTSASLNGPVTQTGGSTNLSGGVTATFSSAYALNGGTFNVAAGSTARFNADVSGDGNFTGGGAVVFNQSYNPGSGPAAVSFGGNVTLRDYSVQIGGVTPGTQYDQLIIAGNVTLDFLFVEMNFTGGFAPTAGQTFDVIDAAGTLTGSAHGYVESGLLPGWEFTVDEIPAQGIVRITALNDAISMADPNLRVWDGGGGNNNLTTSANWIGDIAPASNLASTVLLFDGSVRTTPNLSAPFSARGVYFPSSADTFTFSGQKLSVGAYGIYNEAPAQTFDCPVDFSGVAESTVNADSGGVTFNGQVTLPSGTLRLDSTSGAIRFGAVAGTGTIAPDGFGVAVEFKPSASVHQFDFVTNSDVEILAGGTGLCTFGSSASLSISNASFLVHENLTLDGAPATVEFGNLEVAGGKTWRIQGGSDVDLRNAGFPNFLEGNFIVSGAGSSLALPDFGNDLLFLGGLQVLAGASVTQTNGSLQMIGSEPLLVSGTGSSLTVPKLVLQNNTTPGDDAAFTDGATAIISGDIAVGARLVIGSGANVTGAGHFTMGGGAELEITGAGSTFTLTTTDVVDFTRAVRVAAGGLLALPNTTGATSFDFGGSLELAGGSVQAPAGLVNSSVLACTGGASHVFGPLVNNDGFIDLAGVGTSITFHGSYTAESGGSSFNAATGTTATFLGAVRTGDSFTGAGTFAFDGGYELRRTFVEAPFDVIFSGPVLFAAGNTLTLRAAGAEEFSSEYDRITFEAIGPTSVTWGGTLQMVLLNGFVPEIGDDFFPLNFNPATDAGTFAAFNLPVLPTGRIWDTSQLYSEGKLRIIAATPIEQWRVDQFGTAAYNPEAADGFDADFDGNNNLLEYALGLDPLAPGTAGLPTQSFTTIGPDKFLTLTFTRPLGVTDLNYQVEVGTSPGALLPGSLYGPVGDVPNTAQTTQVSRTVGATTETIVVRDNTPHNSAVSRFIRLKVTRPE